MYRPSAFGCPYSIADEGTLSEPSLHNSGVQKASNPERLLGRDREWGSIFAPAESTWRKSAAIVIHRSVISASAAKGGTVVGPMARFVSAIPIHQRGDVRDWRLALDGLQRHLSPREASILSE